MPDPFCCSDDQEGWACEKPYDGTLSIEKTTALCTDLLTSSHFYTCCIRTLILVWWRYSVEVILRWCDMSTNGIWRQNEQHDQHCHVNLFWTKHKSRYVSCSRKFENVNTPVMLGRVKDPPNGRVVMQQSVVSVLVFTWATIRYSELNPPTPFLLPREPRCLGPGVCSETGLRKINLQPWNTDN